MWEKLHAESRNLIHVIWKTVRVFCHLSYLGDPQDAYAILPHIDATLSPAASSALAAWPLLLLWLAVYSLKIRDTNHLKQRITDARAGIDGNAPLMHRVHCYFTQRIELCIYHGGTTH